MTLGTVAALWRYPVKSMDGVRLDAATLTPRGVPGDRSWALADRSTGRLLSAKRHARLMLCRARYLDEPTPERVPPAELTLPDGTTVMTDDAAAPALLSAFLGLDCVPVLSPGNHFDDRPLHLLTDASLRAMSARSGLPFDARRFRPNILVTVAGDGFPEASWVGRRLRVGSVALDVAKPVKRCVMTTLPSPGLPEERGVLPAVVREGGALGVYAAALAAGTARVGDAVTDLP